MAALLALTAGAVHLGQIGVHLAEGWAIAGFFVVVGVSQVMAAGLLLRPLEKQDANLHRALRTARPNAAERIALEIDQVAGRDPAGSGQAR